MPDPAAPPAAARKATPKSASEPKAVRSKPTPVPNTTAPVPASGAPARVKKAAGKGVSAGIGAVRAAGSATTATATRAVGRGADAVRDTARAVGGVFVGEEPDSGDLSREPVAGFSLKIPFASASLRLPGPGAIAQVGPVTVKLPTGALYYGGLAALVVGGTLELPVAAGAALAGAVVARRWVGRPMPQISVYDSKPGQGPQERSNGSAPPG